MFKQISEILSILRKTKGFTGLCNTHDVMINYECDCILFSSVNLQKNPY